MYDAAVLVGNCLDYLGLDSDVFYTFHVHKSYDFE